MNSDGTAIHYFLQFAILFILKLASQQVTPSSKQTQKTLKSLEAPPDNQLIK
jgi:hypothetical protein